MRVVVRVGDVRLDDAGPVDEGGLDAHDALAAEARGPGDAAVTTKESEKDDGAGAVEAVEAHGRRGRDGEGVDEGRRRWGRRGCRGAETRP